MNKVCVFQKLKVAYYLNLTVAFLLIRKVWDGRFVGKMGYRVFYKIGGWFLNEGGGVGVGWYPITDNADVVKTHQRMQLNQQSK